MAYTYEIWFNGQKYDEIWHNGKEYVEAWQLINGEKTLIWKKSEGGKYPYKYFFLTYNGYLVEVDAEINSYKVYKMKELIDLPANYSDVALFEKFNDTWIFRYWDYANRKYAYSKSEYLATYSTIDNVTISENDSLTRYSTDGISNYAFGSNELISFNKSTNNFALDSVGHDISTTVTTCVTSSVNLVPKNVPVEITRWSTHDNPDDPNEVYLHFKYKIYFVNNNGGEIIYESDPFDGDALNIVMAGYCQTESGGMVLYVSVHYGVRNEYGRYNTNYQLTLDSPTQRVRILLESATSNNTSSVCSVKFLTNESLGYQYVSYRMESIYGYGILKGSNFQSYSEVPIIKYRFIGDIEVHEASITALWNSKAPYYVKENLVSNTVPRSVHETTNHKALILLENGLSTSVVNKAIPLDGDSYEQKWKYLAFSNNNSYAILIDKDLTKIKYIGKYYKGFRCSSDAHVTSYSIQSNYITVYDSQRDRSNHYVYNLNGDYLGKISTADFLISNWINCFGRGDGSVYIGQYKYTLTSVGENLYKYIKTEAFSSNILNGYEFEIDEKRRYQVREIEETYQVFGAEKQEFYDRYSCWIPVKAKAIGISEAVLGATLYCYFMINACTKEYYYFGLITNDNKKFVELAPQNCRTFSNYEALYYGSSSSSPYSYYDCKLDKLSRKDALKIYPSTNTGYTFLTADERDILCYKYQNGKHILGTYINGIFSEGTEIPDTVEVKLGDEYVSERFGSAIRSQYITSYGASVNYKPMIDLDIDRKSDCWGYDMSYLNDVSKDNFVFFDNYNGANTENYRIITDVDKNPVPFS